MKKILVLLLMFSLTACVQNDDILTEDDVQKIIDAELEKIKKEESESVLISDISNQIADVAEEVIDSVFLIACFDREGNQSGTGSGAVFHEDEENYYVFTNYHVVDESSSFKLHFIADVSYEAKLIGTSPENDLAVLKLPKEEGLELKVLEFGDYNDMASWRISFSYW